MIVNAKFKGKDGLLGYKTGCKYRLNFDTVNLFGTTKERVEINNSAISGWDKNTTLKYSSLKKFLQNWEVV